MERIISVILRIMSGVIPLVSAAAPAPAGTLSQRSRCQGQVTAGAGDLLTHPSAVKLTVTQEKGSTFLAGLWCRGRGALP